MEFVRSLNRAETLSKLNGQGKVGKAALWEGRRQGLGMVPGSVARKFMSEVTVYLVYRCREKTCHLFSWMLPSSSQFGRCCFDALPVSSCSTTETTYRRFFYIAQVNGRPFEHFHCHLPQFNSVGVLKWLQMNADFFFFFFCNVNDLLMIFNLHSCNSLSASVWKYIYR